MTRGQLPQRAGSLGLNGGGAAAAVPPNSWRADCDDVVTSTGCQQLSSCCTLLLLQQHFHSVRLIPAAFLHQSLVRPVAAVSWCHASFRLIQFNGKLGEVVTAFKLRSVTMQHYSWSLDHVIRQSCILNNRGIISSHSTWRGSSTL